MTKCSRCGTKMELMKEELDPSDSTLKIKTYKCTNTLWCRVEKEIIYERDTTLFPNHIDQRSPVQTEGQSNNGK